MEEIQDVMEEICHLPSIMCYNMESNPKLTTLIKQETKDALMTKQKSSTPLLVTKPLHQIPQINLFQQ